MGGGSAMSAWAGRMRNIPIRSGRRSVRMMCVSVECHDEVADRERFLAMRIGLAILCVLGGIAVPQDPPLPPEMAFAPLPSRAPEPKDNPSSPEKIDLGRQLFFDPILSPSGTIACATCHQPAHAWTDG